MDVDHLLQTALEHHQAGNQTEAARLYQDLLSRDPNNVNALYLFGCLAHQAGNQKAALDLLTRAIQLAPDRAQFHNALSLTLTSLGQAKPARSAIERAIQLDPQPQFWNTLGSLLKTQGEMVDAMLAFQQALERDPSYHDAQYNLGNTHRCTGDLQAAINCFHRVLSTDSQHLHALAAMGQCLLQTNRPAEAIPFLEQAVSLQPNDLELRCDLADACVAGGDSARALALYQSVIQADDSLARAWFSLGCLQNTSSNVADAQHSFEKAVARNPGWLEARHNYGQALFAMGRVSEAVCQFRICSQNERGAISRAMLAVVIPGDPAATNLDILNARRAWCDETAVPVTVPLLPAPRTHSRPLRIGYLSSFFHRDPWMKPVWGLLNSHDRNRFQLHLISDCPATAINHGYQPHPEDTFHDISELTNAAAASLIKSAQLDILIDLNGYSCMQRFPILRSKSAPVVVGWFNYYATSGLRTVDYLIGDHATIPVDEELCYTERILRVQGSYLTFHVHYPVPLVEPRLPGKNFIFGCLGSQYKLTPEVITAWSAILNGAPESSILIKNKVLASEAARQQVINQFVSQGVSPARIHLEGPADHFHFLQAYQSVDLALDTFPYNGGTTTTEAIWQGVPVLTFPGDRWVSRTSASLLIAANLERFVTRDVSQYVSLAIRYATEPVLQEELTSLRMKMRQLLTSSSVCNVTAFTRRMEDLLLSVHNS